MPKRGRWTVGSNQYKKTPQTGITPGQPRHSEASLEVHTEIAQMHRIQQYGDVSPSLLNSRPILCKALDALAEQRDAITVVGAHAVHEQTSELELESTQTQDGDATVTPELVNDMPRIDELMRGAGFRTASEMASELPADHPGRRLENNLGLWGTSIDETGDLREEMDLIVPSSLVVGKSRRSVPNLKHHGKTAFNRGEGNELAVLEREERQIVNYDDDSVRTAWVAKPSGLICAKSYNITDRLTAVSRGQVQRGEKLPKDSADMLRCMIVSEPDQVRSEFEKHYDHPASGEAVREGARRFRELLHSEQLAEYASRGADWPEGRLTVDEEVQRWREEF